MRPSAMFYNNDVSNRNKFGEWLKSTRKEYGYSVRELAEMIGVSAAYISDIEKGNRHAPVNHLEQIAKIFNIPETELMYFTDLAGSSVGSWQDINDYLGKSKNARAAPSMIRDAPTIERSLIFLIASLLGAHRIYAVLLFGRN